MFKFDFLPFLARGGVFFYVCVEVLEIVSSFFFGFLYWFFVREKLHIFILFVFFVIFFFMFLEKYSAVFFSSGVLSVRNIYFRCSSAVFLEDLAEGIFGNVEFDRFID